jgi:hypothetical protein
MQVTVLPALKPSKPPQRNHSLQGDGCTDGPGEGLGRGPGDGDGDLFGGLGLGEGDGTGLALGLGFGLGLPCVDCIAQVPLGSRPATSLLVPSQR